MKSSGRGFDSRQLHQKYGESIFDGADKVFDRAAEIRNATRQAIDVKEAKRVTANESTYALAA